MTAPTVRPQAAESGPERRGSRRSAVGVVVLMVVSVVLGMNATGSTTLVLAAILIVAALPLITAVRCCGSSSP